MAVLVAVPSQNPGGLKAGLMSHFGHCDVFTLVEMENGGVKTVSVLPNAPHEHGACTAPVQTLADHGVKVMLAGGMGMRPLQAFEASGIKVMFTGLATTVEQAVNDFAQNKLPVFGDNGLCKGGCGHH